MEPPEGPPPLRIGELSLRLGVSDHVLRAWESRYGLLRPVRSAGGFRLYSEAGALRVRRMRARLVAQLTRLLGGNPVAAAGNIRVATVTILLSPVKEPR